MKVFNWSLALVLVATIATSCGQPKSNRKKASEPQANLLIQETAEQIFAESELDPADKGLIILNHVNQGNSFVGNIYYGTTRGEQMTLSFDHRNGSSYVYVNLMSPKRNTYTGIQPTQTSEINVSYFKIRLHANTNCLIVEDTIGNYEAVVCKQ